MLYYSIILFFSFCLLSHINSSNITHSGISLETSEKTLQHPVVLIPGFTTSRLVVEKGRECSEKRNKPIYASGSSLGWITDTKCFLDHMKLDSNGTDPSGIKVRPGSGFESAEAVYGYWVWTKIIKELEEDGYEKNKNLIIQPYDWRLSPILLEERDKYFSNLKETIEKLYEKYSLPVSIFSHSYGSNLVLFFFQWVESSIGGGGGDKWVAQHIDSFANIGGPLLGIPKALSTLTSAEYKEMTKIPTVVNKIIESTNLNREERLTLFRSWSSIYTLLPSGGNRIWGNKKTAPDDFTTRFNSKKKKFKERKIQNLLRKHKTNGVLIRYENQAITANNQLKFLYQQDPDLKNFERFINHGDTEKIDKLRMEDWSNPLRSRLPNAPNLKIFCLYGIGLPTERSYQYKKDESSESIIFDTSKSNIVYSKGVRDVDGDFTVPLVSLGYMCESGWKSGKKKKNKRLNPYGVKIITREIQHESARFYKFRGGGVSGNHVDIMGNKKLIADLREIAKGSSLINSVTSDLPRIIRNIDG